MIIRPEDSLDKLVVAGILPQWIAEDALPHGMDEAQHILNEYDWISAIAAFLAAIVQWLTSALPGIPTIAALLAAIAIFK